MIFVKIEPIILDVNILLTSSKDTPIGSALYNSLQFSLNNCIILSFTYFTDRNHNSYSLTLDSIYGVENPIFPQKTFFKDFREMIEYIELYLIRLI